jgi:Kef-type K+ transport system membrane component KefB
VNARQTHHTLLFVLVFGAAAAKKSDRIIVAIISNRGSMCSTMGELLPVLAAQNILLVMFLSRLAGLCRSDGAVSPTCSMCHVFAPYQTCLGGVANK